MAIKVNNQMTVDEKVRYVEQCCDAFLGTKFMVGWNDLADNTSIYDWVEEDTDIEDNEKVSDLVKDICWDKLDLDETIYMAMSRGQLNEAIYGL